MKLAELLLPASIVFPLQSTSKKQAIVSLLNRLVENNFVSDKAVALNDILTREKHLSTGMENGLAIPHAKSDSVNRLVVAFGVHKEGVEFETLDGKPAHFIFLVMSPRDTSGPHIQALASISRIIKNANTRDDLLQAQSVEAVHSLFQNL